MVRHLWLRPRQKLKCLRRPVRQGLEDVPSEGVCRAAEEDDHSGGGSAGSKDPAGLLGCVDLFLWTGGLAGEFAGGVRQPVSFCFFLCLVPRGTLGIPSRRRQLPPASFPDLLLFLLSPESPP